MRLAHLCHALDVDANCLLAGLPKPNCKQRDLIKKALTRKRSPRRLKI
jgi:hypothetical protein